MVNQNPEVMNENITEKKPRTQVWLSSGVEYLPITYNKPWVQVPGLKIKKKKQTNQPDWEDILVQTDGSLGETLGPECCWLSLSPEKALSTMLVTVYTHLNPSS